MFTLKIFIYNFIVYAFNKFSTLNYYRQSEVSNLRLISEPERTIFFGYHDKIPFNGEGDKILCHRGKVSSADKGAIITEIDVGYYELANGHEPVANSFKQLGATTSWCWQQGSMLQWLPGSDFKKVVYNDVIQGQYGARIVDIYTKQVKELASPIYALNQDGTLALSVDFGRLGWLRPGYGYIHPGIKVDRSVNHPEDGLTLVDIQHGEQEPIVRLKELIPFLSKEEKNQYSYINHASFSPGSNKVIFFHIITDLKDKRRIRLFFYDMNTRAVELLMDDKAISHFCWIESDKMLLTFTEKCYFGTWRYGILDLNTKMFTVLKGAYVSDGHPMMRPGDRTSFISDSYPDKKGNYFVFESGLKSNKKKVLHLFHSPKEFRGEVRCDLHPRWNHQGNVICIDVVVEGFRGLGLLKP
jgi:hypothetical protein